jgi:hypothetical protein
MFTQAKIEDFVVFFVAIVLYLITALVLKAQDILQKLFLGFSTILSSVFVWQLLHTIVASDGIATFLSLLVYTLFGLFIIWYYTNKLDETKSKVGKYILGIVALRVIFVDAWSFENTLVGIFICIVIGMLLLSTTIISKKK